MPNKRRRHRIWIGRQIRKHGSLFHLLTAITKRYFLPLIKKSIFARRPLFEAMRERMTKMGLTRRQRRKHMRRLKRGVRMRVDGGLKITVPSRYTRTDLL